MEDEIDLRKYLDVLFRHWKLIVTIIVITAVGASLVSLVMAPTYEAKAEVLIINTSQRGSLVALAGSSIVAARALEQLGDALELREQTVKVLLDRVQVVSDGNLIEFSVESSDPEQAAAIANAWVNSYESLAASHYSAASQSPEKLEFKAGAAMKEFEEKEKVWEDNITNNRIDELTRQISDKELLCDAKVLREQIEVSPSSEVATMANSLALILLQTRASTALPVQLQVSLDRLSGVNTSMTDIDALISMLETRTGNTPGQSISELRQDIFQLKAELEKEKAKSNRLEDSRDTAWQVYMTLLGEVFQARIETQVLGPPVQVAVAAAVPSEPVKPRWVTNVGFALALGLILGTFAAFGAESFGKKGATRKKKEEE